VTFLPRDAVSSVAANLFFKVTVACDIKEILSVRCRVPGVLNWFTFFVR
jgi:hypothetical protein